MLGQRFSMQNFIHFIRKNLQNFVHLQTWLIQINLPQSAIESVVSDIFEWMIWCEIKNAFRKMRPWKFYDISMKTFMRTQHNFLRYVNFSIYRLFFIVEISFVTLNLLNTTQDTTSQDPIIFLLFIPSSGLSSTFSLFPTFSLAFNFFQSFILYSSSRLEVVGHSAKNVYLLAMNGALLLHTF